MIEYENLGKVNAPFWRDLQTSFSNTLEEGWFVLGKKVKMFEEEFAEYCESPYFVGLASGLDALLLALKALDFEAGSEVIVPSNTYIATILAIIQAGHRPILVEPDLATYNLDPRKIEEKISAKTKAIMPVHLYGKSCDMGPIMNIAKKYHLKVVEDCAQAHGATYKGRKVGSFGDINAFSFYPTKSLGALGDAGGVTVKKIEHLAQIRRLRNYGSEIKYQNEIVGFNSRLDEIQAGFLSVKLKKLDEINNKKRSLARIYLQTLKNDFICPVVQEDFHDVYHIFNIRHERRDLLKEYLFKNGIMTEVHYPIPPHRQKAMIGILSSGNYEISELIHRTTLSLPVSYFHTEDNVIKISEIMNKF